MLQTFNTWLSNSAVWKIKTYSLYLVDCMCMRVLLHFICLYTLHMQRFGKNYLCTTSDLTCFTSFLFFSFESCSFIKGKISKLQYHYFCTMKGNSVSMFIHHLIQVIHKGIVRNNLPGNHALLGSGFQALCHN